MPAKFLSRWLRLLFVFAIPVVIGASVCYFNLLGITWFGTSLPPGLQTFCKVLIGLDLGYLAFLLFRDWFYYREAESPADDLLPFCSVVIPAYNEGKRVMRSIQSVLASDYPHDKLEVIAVDDGSCDETWAFILQAQIAAKGRLQVLRHEVNKGKKEALASGIRATRGSIVITIDSDTLIRPRTIRRLVAPFTTDPTVGSVAGNIRVNFGQRRLIPQMLTAIFTYNFDVVRAGQSTCHAVICTPGALSAYRRDLLEPKLAAWLGQKFMGQPSTIGEDRALASLILRQGYGVVFQRSAVAYTCVPEDYRGLCKMLLRWIRSDIRENVMFANYVFSKFDLRDRRLLCMQLTWILSSLWMSLASVSLVLLAYCTVTSNGFILIVAFIAAIFRGSVQAFINLAYRDERSAVYAYIFSAFSLLGLFWIPAYALFTLRNSKWLTREKRL